MVKDPQQIMRLVMLPGMLIVAAFEVVVALVTQRQSHVIVAIGICVAAAVIWRKQSKQD